MDDKGVLLIEIISTLFVAKLVEEKMLNRTEIKDSFEILVDYQNELYGADYEIILDEKDCPIKLTFIFRQYYNNCKTYQQVNSSNSKRRR